MPDDQPQPGQTVIVDGGELGTGLAHIIRLLPGNRVSVQFQAGELIVPTAWLREPTFIELLSTA